MAGYRGQGYGKGQNSQEKGSNRNAASATMIGESFHNPYTFIPFPGKVQRKPPTTLTADEHPDKCHRLSGVLDLDIKTLSPLMTCNPVPVSGDKEQHKVFKALTIGNDVVVPATGVRGALRTLMTVLSGGTLGYMDEDLWLTQGRDAHLGPSGKMPGVPDQAFLAQVVTPGSATSSGVVQLGETKLERADVLKKQISNLDRERPDAEKRQRSLVYQDSKGEEWKVKLSGRPINPKNKKEGLFKANGKLLELSESFWTSYQGRHRHSAMPELRRGDLVWLEPSKKDCTRIVCEADVKSIQWARWGRSGVSLKNIISSQVPQVLPDSMRIDGGVDMVTDLFGQIPKKEGAAGPFAARIRPGNLIFFDAKDKTTTETLAPLAAPHPGCIAFYRDQDDLDKIDKNSSLKGYKVYRNTGERGNDAPWKYSVQGVYEEQGRLKMPAQQKLNKTAELLNEGLTGKLRISFRALDPGELALIYAACSVDWKLGGGKPLGLGHCRVTGIELIDEDGNISRPMEDAGTGNNLKMFQADQKQVDHLQKRIELYRTSQVPVERLRYPRAVSRNNNKNVRAGLSWFARHASPKKSGQGLETMWTKGELRQKVNASQIKAQALPRLDAADHNADLLYGYDMVDLDVDSSNRNQRLVGRMEAFAPSIHASSDETAGVNTSQNRETRKAVKSQRSHESMAPMPPMAQITKDNIGSLIAEEFKNKIVTRVRAKEFREKAISFGITPETSNKWRKRFKLLEDIISKG